MEKGKGKGKEDEKVKKAESVSRVLVVDFQMRYTLCRAVACVVWTPEPWCSGSGSMLQPEAHALGFRPRAWRSNFTTSNTLER